VTGLLTLSGLSALSKVPKVLKVDPAENLMKPWNGFRILRGELFCSPGLGLLKSSIGLYGGRFRAFRLR